MASEGEPGVEGEVYAPTLPVKLARGVGAGGVGCVCGLARTHSLAESRLRGLDGHVASLGEAEHDAGFRFR